jgi:hypothetical protein
VSILDRNQILRRLLDDLGAVAATDDRDPFAHVGDGLLDGVGVGLLDLLALPRVSQSPHGRYGLRGAEHTVDPAAVTAVRTGSAQPRPALWVAAFHQRDEVLAARRTNRLDAEPFERLRVCQPPSGRLGHLAVGREVVVAALRRDGL